jgi:uncharacterized protein DUF6350
VRARVVAALDEAFSGSRCLIGDTAEQPGLPGQSTPDWEHGRVSLPNTRGPAPQRIPAVGAWLLSGALAAGLGLGILAVLVLLLWISSPYSPEGPGDALHLAADLWLAAHGAHLVRTSTLTGQSLPVGLTPLLLVVLPGWLLHRATRSALADDDTAAAESAAHGRLSVGYLPVPEVDPVRAVGWVCGGYLLVGAVTLSYASTGPLRVDALSAAVRLPALTFAFAALAAWRACGRPALAWPRSRALRGAAHVAVRAALLSCTVLAVVGAALVAVSILWHAVADGTPPQTGADSWPGRVAVALLALALLPNAAVWGASYGLGPGVTLGAGGVATPINAGGYPALPGFPLFDALPAPGGPSPLTCLAVVVPLAAVLVLAGRVARAAVPADAGAGRPHRTTGPWGTALTAALAGAGFAALVTVLAAAAGGPMGTGRLAHVGPVWWQTGVAALGWSVAVGVPAALGMRAVLLRGLERPGLSTATPLPGPVRHTEEDWHSSRRGRWAALKQTPGNLLTDVLPHRRP